MGKIETATEWMINLANDDSHGYSQEHRDGPDYDCSSAVIHAWQNAGVPVKTNGATNTSNIYSVFTKSGFSDITSLVKLSSGAGLAYGDIVLKPKTSSKGGHVVMFIGDGQIVHASTSDGHPETGDQTGKEICTRSYYSGDWVYVLRYTAEGSVGSQGIDTIKEFQTWLNTNYAAGLTVDGVYGSNTKKAATKAYQTVLGVTASGVFDAATKAAVVTLSSNNKGNAVYLLQGMLNCRGFNTFGFSGTFYSGTKSAVTNFQTRKGLSVTGNADSNTMYALYN